MVEQGPAPQPTTEPGAPSAEGAPTATAEPPRARRAPAKTKATTAARPRRPAARRKPAAPRAKAPRAKAAAPPAPSPPQGPAARAARLVTTTGGVVVSGAKVAATTAIRTGGTLGRMATGAGRTLASTGGAVVTALRRPRPAEVEANAAMVRRVYRALLKGDASALERMIAEDAVWHVPGRSALAGDHRGRDGIAKLFASLAERSGGTLRVDLHDVTASAEHAVALQHVRATRDGARLESKQLVVVHIHAGLITEVWGPASLTPYEDDEFWGTEA